MVAKKSVQQILRQLEQEAALSAKVRAMTSSGSGEQRAFVTGRFVSSLEGYEALRRLETHSKKK